MVEKLILVIIFGGEVEDRPLKPGSEVMRAIIGGVAGDLRAMACQEPAAWRVNAWRRQVPISRSKFYEERNAGRIKTVKVGSATLVVTTPKDYLAAMAA